MNLKMKWEIVVNEEGKVVNANENLYRLTEAGYQLYPLDVPIIIYKNRSSKPSGTAIIKEIVLKDNQTEVLYQLIALSSVN